MDMRGMEDSTAHRFMEYRYRDEEDRSRHFTPLPGGVKRDFISTTGGERVFVYEKRDPLDVAGCWLEDGSPLYYRWGRKNSAETVFALWGAGGQLERWTNISQEEAAVFYRDMVEYWRQAECAR